MSRLTRFTSLGRPIDPRYASNRFAVAASAAAAAIAFAWTLSSGDTPNVAAAAAARGGLSVFLAWAVGRELDPDDVRAAALATPPAVLALLAGPASLAGVVAVLLAGRIVLRSTGLPPTTLDLAALVALAGYVGTTPLGVVGVAGLAAAMVIDSRLDGPAPEHHAWVGMATLVVGVGAAWFGGDWPAWEAPGPVALGLVGGGVAAALTLRTYRPVSHCDHVPRPLDPHRLRVARGLVVGMTLAWAVAGGAAGIAAMGPVWAAMVGAGVAAAVTRSGRPPRLRAPAA